MSRPSPFAPPPPPPPPKDAEEIDFADPKRDCASSSLFSPIGATGCFDGSFFELIDRNPPGTLTWLAGFAGDTGFSSSSAGVSPNPPTL